MNKKTWTLIWISILNRKGKKINKQLTKEDKGRHISCSTLKLTTCESTKLWEKNNFGPYGSKVFRCLKSVETPLIFNFIFALEYYITCRVADSNLWPLTGNKDALSIRLCSYWQNLIPFFSNPIIKKDHYLYKNIVS